MTTTNDSSDNQHPEPDGDQEEEEQRLQKLFRSIHYMWSILKPFFTFDHLLTVCVSILFSQFVVHFPSIITSFFSSSPKALKRRRRNRSIQNMTDDGDSLTAVPSPEQTQLAIQTLSQRLNTQRQINLACTRHNAQLESQLNEMEKSLNQSSQMIEQLQNDRTLLESQLLDCRQKLHDQAQEIDRLKSQCTEMERENERLRSVELKQAHEQLEHAQSECRALESKLESCEKQLMKANETQRVFEYVISKSSPELAKILLEQLTEHHNNKNNNDNSAATTEEHVPAQTDSSDNKDNNDKEQPASAKEQVERK